MSVRNIIHIDEERCTGCGRCVRGCAEGAIRIVDGKARVIDEAFCDGAGLCLPHCPHGAIVIEKRDAPDFDASAAEAYNAKHPAPQRDQRNGTRSSRHQGSTAHHHDTKYCTVCGTADVDTVLLKGRVHGEKGWVCVKCLPKLIHG